MTKVSISGSDWNWGRSEKR